MPAIILALLQAAATLLPEIADAMPSIEAVINGTASATDLTALETLTATLNEQAAQAESAAGATGPTC